MEFTRPGEEYTPPAAEFTPVSSSQEFPKKPRKRLLRRLAAAFAGLTLLAAGAVAARPTQPAEALPPPRVEVQTPTEPSVPPTTLPAPTEPLPEPDVEGVMVLFSSEAKGILLFSQPERIRSVHATVWETVLEMAVEEYEIPADEIAGGEYRIPAFELWDIYMNSREKYDETGKFPTPELRVTVVYDGDAGERELQKSFPFREEQGWGVMYYQESLEPSEYVFPGYFVVRTYTSSEKTDLLTDENEPLLPGQMRLQVSVEGESISPDSFRVEYREPEGYRVDESGESIPVVSYQTVVFVPKPENLPETGTGIARFTVSQQLKNYDYLWVSEVEVPF